MVRVCTYPLGNLKATVVPDSLVVDNSTDDRTHRIDPPFISLEKWVKQECRVPTSFNQAIKELLDPVSERVGGDRLF